MQCDSSRDPYRPDDTSSQGEIRKSKICTSIEPGCTALRQDRNITETISRRAAAMTQLLEHCAAAILQWRRFKVRCYFTKVLLHHALLKIILQLVTSFIG